jgi:hypothetical protein
MTTFWETLLLLLTLKTARFCKTFFKLCWNRKRYRNFYISQNGTAINRYGSTTLAIKNSQYTVRSPTCKNGNGIRKKVCFLQSAYRRSNLTNSF